jgi:putative transposase
MTAASPETKLTKVQIAASLGVSRASLYYLPKRPIQDEATKIQIEHVLKGNPAYGHKRIAIELKANHKKILRVMKLFGLKPRRRHIYPPPKTEDQNKEPTGYPNLIRYLCPIRPNVVWVVDFSYFKFHGSWYYLATVMGLFTREILGFALSKWHNKELVLAALAEATKNQLRYPLYHHSDQGSEYEATEYLNKLKTNNVAISMSAKGCPWENGYQESFYDKFKVDLGDPDRFDSLGELVEAMQLTIYYYNERRIHSSLKMPPRRFREQYEQNQNQFASRLSV